MSGSTSKSERRRLRRAIGAAAADALLDQKDAHTEIKQFLLLSFSLRRRIWWFLTGRF